MEAIAPKKKTEGTASAWTDNHLTVKMGYETGWLGLLPVMGLIKVLL
jgi:hypothetical protein